MRVKREARPGLEPTNTSISFGYPATITTTSSRWSSISFSRVAIASWPKSLVPAYWVSEYASSMNRTPPRACSNTRVVFGPVCPTYSPTSAERSASTR
ncbi:hypothetical protein CTU88_30030 [Streptomyces sp. JV178]|nr:hypothetical protein CTU88_30030 [Streptomyces sp. JV178]